MPKPVVSIPESLLPYKVHGLEVSWKTNSKEATARCLLCDKEDKFSIDINTSQWRCLRCGEMGNQYTFLRHLYEISASRSVSYTELAKSRGIKPETLERWGVVKSILTDEWIVPGYSADKTISQLYRWVKLPSEKKFKLLATKTIGHGLHGMNLFDDAKDTIYLCEGPWDAMKLWETLAAYRMSSEGPVPAKKGGARNLLAKANVLAVPGCTTFNENWAKVFQGKKVFIVFDNDYPKRNQKTGAEIEPAGLVGVKHISGMLHKLPKDIQYYEWGPGGYNRGIEDGADVRDLLNVDNPGQQLGKLLEGFVNTEKDWRKPKKLKEMQENALPEPQECKDWKAVSNTWRKAMKWMDGYDVSLSVMLACTMSTKLPGDQLWVKIVGPPSCGKTSLCEAISTAKKYVVAKSTIRGFHSGFKTGNDEDEEDNSLIVQVTGKTLVTKDGDTLLQSPNLGQILSEARDIYDGESRTHYRNKMSKEYEGVRMTWILCGTSSLRSMDKSELGERFLDCVIMDGIDEDMENDVLWRVVQRTNRNLSELDDKVKRDKNMEQAMALTGGYVCYLRENAISLLNAVQVDEWVLRRIMELGKFVAYMRARPSTSQEETTEREFAARLTSQLMRLTKCMAVVLNKETVDREVVRRVTKVAMDTARGRTLDLGIKLYHHHDEGMELKTLSLLCRQDDGVTRKLIKFLREINVVEPVEYKRKGIRQKVRWKLTDTLYQLYDSVLEGT